MIPNEDGEFYNQKLCFLKDIEGYEEKDNLLIGSGSGNTSSLVSISENAKEIGVSTKLFTIDSNNEKFEFLKCKRESFFKKIYRT